MLFWQKLLAILVIIAAIFSSGMYTEYKFHLASQSSFFKAEVKKAQKGQADIINFQQELNHVKKDTCFNTNLPTDLNKLLK